MSNSIIIVAWPLNGPVLNSPQVFPISCREIHLASPLSLSSHLYHSASLSLVFFSCSSSLVRGRLFPEFIHASWWRGPHYPRWMDSSPIPLGPTWISLSYSLVRSRHPTPSARISPSFLFFSFIFFFFLFSKVAVSRKPGRSLGFRGLCSNSASWWSKASLLDHDAVSKTERARVLVREIRL